MRQTVDLSIAIDANTPSQRARVGFHAHAETMATVAGLSPGTDFFWLLLTAHEVGMSTAVTPAMRSIPIEYDAVRNAGLRIDQRIGHDVYALRAKKPAATGAERA